jgi:hypothetical protein
LAADGHRRCDHQRVLLCDFLSLKQLGRNDLLEIPMNRLGAKVSRWFEHRRTTTESAQERLAVETSALA